MKKISRRDFLKGTAAAAFGVTAMELGVIPSFAAETSNSTMSDGSWYDTSYFEQPEEISDIAEVIDTEIVVIGAGNGGCVAAASAADLGADVVLVEKSSGCVTWAGEMAALNSTVAKEEYGVSYTEEEINQIVNDICSYASYDCDQRLISLWAHNSGRTMDWFVDKMAEKDIKMFLETDMKETRYQTLPVTHTVYKEFVEMGPNMMGAQISNPAFLEHCTDMGVNQLFEHNAVQLIQDEETKMITGVIVQRLEDEAYIQINASKGVIISTGGYGGNKEMMAALRYRDKDIICNDFGCHLNNGDGIKMAMWCGADIDRNHAGGISFDRAAVALDHHTGDPYASTLEDIWWCGSQPWLNVNVNGERFCNEDSTYDFHIAAFQKQPGHIAFQIFDSNYWTDVNAFHTTICARVVAAPGARNSEVLPGVYPCQTQEEFDTVFMQPALDSGRLIQADSLEDLAEQLGLPVDKTLETITRYNELCEAGVDSDFGKQTKDLTPIKEPPYYGIAIGQWLLSTFNGVRVNTNLEAVNSNGEALGGLYMIGNDMGGFFANSYPQLYGGLAQGKTVCFARLATLHAVTGSIDE